MTTQQQIQDGVPVIDMSLDDESVALQFIQAFTTIGFATLTNHGVDPKIISRGFDASKSFFELSAEEKLRYKFQGYESNRGFIPLGLEKHDGSLDIKPDKKETFDIGNEDEVGFENNWPTAPRGKSGEEFRNDILAYFDAFDALHLKIMRLLAIGLGLPDENFLVERCNAKHENMRLLHYPSLSVEEDDEHAEDTIIRGNVHTDFGTITLLTQDDVGGLRAQRLDGSWVFVRPVTGGIVVNVGDMLERWCANKLRATPHQVVDVASRDCKSRGKTRIIPERYSIAFFCNANKDTLLECLDACSTDESATKYPPINAHEYLTQRLAATISREASSST